MGKFEKEKTKQKNKKWLLIPVAVLLLALAVAAGAAGYNAWYQSRHIYVEDAVYEKDAAQLDLRGTGISLSHYEQVREALPDCQIRWDLPFQGGFLPDDTRELTLTSLTDGDVELLDYLTELESVDGTNCRDYDQLVALQKRRPELNVTYNVMLLGREYAQDTAELHFDGEEPKQQELADVLKCLPGMKTVHFVQPQMAAAELRQLQADFPEIAITWEKDAFGSTYPDSVTEIDLSGWKFESLDEVAAAMAYYPGLEKLVMCDCGFDNETMAAFREQVRGEYKVVWSVKVGRKFLRTDDPYYMPQKYGETVNSSQLGNLRYCEDMLCVDLGHNNILDISWLEGMTHLRYLIVADAPLADISPVRHCKELVYIEFFDTNVHDLTPLLECTALEDLNLAMVYHPDFKVLTQMPWLKNLWLNMNTIPPADKSYLVENLPDTRINFEGGLATYGGWRQLQNYYDMRDLLEMPYNVW